MTPERQQYLFNGYFMKTASASEVHELMAWLAERADDTEVARLMDAAWVEFESSRKVFTQTQSSSMLEQILQQRPGTPVTAPVIRSRRKMIIRFSAAATVLVLLGAGIYGYLSKDAQAPAIINNTTSVATNASDIQPAQDKAILTLANGEQIVLDDAGNGSLSGDNGMQLIKLNGQLSYKANTASPNGELMYNTISTAKGRQYKLVLADGTTVWLNAASSLRFPVNFSGDERRVELNGEAFFEVARDSKRTFSVDMVSQSKAAKGTITALGTSFNVNGYDNEPSIATTLLEGSVRIASGQTNSMVLKPGQQARFTQQHISLTEEVNTDQVLAWKNNLFQFENESIEDIMRQLSRWYDINVTYEGALPTRHFFGSIRRQVSLTEVLHMLEIAGGISFRIEANNVIIKAQ